MNTTNIIKEKYVKLINLISLISNDVKIETWTKLSLNIHVYVDKKKLISFKLYKISESSNTLEIEWRVLNCSIGHWNFPDYFDQRYMFNTLASKISNWQQEVANCNIKELLKQAQNAADGINNAQEDKYKKSQ